MKQITILMAALVLTFAETYSAGLTLNTDFNDYNQFASLLANDSDLDFNSAPVISGEVVTENTDDEDESLVEEEANVTGNENDDELFDSSAGAMGLGIF